MKSCTGKQVALMEFIEQEINSDSNQASTALSSDAAKRSEIPRPSSKPATGVEGTCTKNEF